MKSHLKFLTLLILALCFSLASIAQSQPPQKFSFQLNGKLADGNMIVMPLEAQG